jgi:phosphohistidine phosphatase SixA
LLAGKRAVCAFDLKEHVKVLAQCCVVMTDITVGHDPKVADWLLEPGSKEKNFHAMVSTAVLACILVSVFLNDVTTNLGCYYSYCLHSLCHYEF